MLGAITGLITPELCHCVTGPPSKLFKMTWNYNFQPTGHSFERSSFRISIRKDSSQRSRPVTGPQTLGIGLYAALWHCHSGNNSRLWKRESGFQNVEDLNSFATCKEALSRSHWLRTSARHGMFARNLKLKCQLMLHFMSQWHCQNLAARGSGPKTAPVWFRRRLRILPS